MAELKTKKNNDSVGEFMKGIEDPAQRADCRKISAMMKKATGSRPKMWGDSIVGFGSYSYSNSAGKDFEWMLTGFSPRKRATSVYIMAGFDRFDALMKKLGRFKTGKSCLYIKRLDDIDEVVLQQLVDASVKQMRRKHATK